MISRPLQSREGGARVGQHNEPATCEQQTKSVTQQQSEFLKTRWPGEFCQPNTKHSIAQVHPYLWTGNRRFREEFKERTKSRPKSWGATAARKNNPARCLAWHRTILVNGHCPALLPRRETEPTKRAKIVAKRQHQLASKYLKKTTYETKGVMARC
jgi:hypothetical protein